MPISVDSSGGVAFDYSIRNVNKIDSTNNTEIRPEEKQESNKTQTQVRQELPKDEVEALFFNRQDSQLTRDILNTYASKQDSSNEISFTNLDAYEKLLQNKQPEREPTQNIQPRLEGSFESESEVNTTTVPQRAVPRESESIQSTEPRPERAFEVAQEVNTEPLPQRENQSEPVTSPTQNLEPRTERTTEVAQDVNSETIAESLSEPDLEPTLVSALNTEPRPDRELESEQEVNTEDRPHSEAASVSQTDDVTNNL